LYYTFSLAKLQGTKHDGEQSLNFGLGEKKKGWENNEKIG